MPSRPRRAAFTYRAACRHAGCQQRRGADERHPVEPRTAHQLELYSSQTSWGTAPPSVLPGGVDRPSRADVLFHPPPSVRPVVPPWLGTVRRGTEPGRFWRECGFGRRADGGDLQLVLGAARRQAVRGRTLAIVKAFARLTVVVLVVVAIGIGVSASSWNQPTYGPSWGRFSIEFPSAPTTHVPRHGRLVHE